MMIGTGEFDKAGAVTADRIQNWISNEGWPIGLHLGTEPDLMARFTVSRGVLREALRMLEQRGVVETRRGRGGGVVVSRPSTDAVVEAAVPYLRFRGVRPNHTFEARRALELSMVPLIIDRMNNDNARTLEQFLEWEGTLAKAPDEFFERKHTAFRGFHTILAALTGNPALELFVHVLESLTIAAYRRNRNMGQIQLDDDTIYQRHCAVAAALIAKDAERALRELDEAMVLTRDLYGEPDPVERLKARAASILLPDK
jgi:DNA-binding FadR family transcriptional regulator